MKINEDYKEESYEKNFFDEIFKFMRKYDCDITRGLRPKHLTEFTKLVEMIAVATDMEQHFKHYNEFKAFLTKNSDLPKKEKVLFWLLKCADISQMSKGKRSFN